MKSTHRFLIALFSLGVSSTALAHTGHGLHGFNAGLLHPFSGLDHLLAMFAIGLWAAQAQHRQAIWWLPLGFMSAMLLGAMWAMPGAGLVFAESGIAASLIGLGLLLALALRVPLAFAIALGAGFGLFHGYAHGMEMPLSVTSLAYGAGFLLATAMLHGCGIALGLGLRARSSWLGKGLGLLIGSTGLWTLMS